MAAGPAQVDLTGKVAFIAGVADSTGYGWAIARSLAGAGATIVVGTWPPVLKIFQMGLRKGSFDDDSALPGGGKMEIAKVRREGYKSARSGDLSELTHHTCGLH